jgi:hypothetical protein
MVKKFFLCLVMMLTLVSSTSPAFAKGSANGSHQIKNKWDLSGSFAAHPSYNWGGLAEGATWNYSIHIKEATNGDYSAGSIHFWTGDIDVVGKVKATQRNYAYWSGDNLAAVGTATYNDRTYYFMFLYAKRATWFALSTTPYDSYWANGTVWGSGLRAYQLHSKVPDETFPFVYKAVH